MGYAQERMEEVEVEGRKEGGCGKGDELLTGI